MNTSTKDNKFKLGWLMILSCVIVCLTASALAAEFDEIDDDNGIQAEQTYEIEAVEEPMDVNVEAGSEYGVGGDIQSLTFKKNIGIQDALRFISLKYNRNIVPAPGVDGTLAFTSLHDVTFEEAMSAIMGNKLVYETEGSLTKVYTKDEYKKLKTDKDRMQSKVFELYYISGAEARKLISPVLSDAGIVESSTAADTTLPTGESITSGTAGGDSMALNDRIVILDYPENLAEAEELLKKIDKRPKQVLVEATILAAKLTEDMEFGVDWTALQSSGFLTNPGNVAGNIIASPGTFIKGFSNPGGSGLTTGITIDDVQAVISALETITDVTTMANPKVMAVNKQLGQVYIGNKVGYREGNIVGSGGVVQEGAVKFLDTGTKLSFRPYIGDDGFIRMDIQPKDSTGDLDARGIPQERAVEIATNLMVKDGQTVVIGGLFRDAVSATRSQVPLLGDIPFLGVLFRSTTDKVEREEVIILLTPHIISDPAEVNGEARREDIRRKMDAAKGMPQWITRSHHAEANYQKAVEAYREGDYVTALEKLEWTLHIRPSYLEAIRLKERIVTEMNQGDSSQIERIILQDIEQEDSPNWRRN